MKIARNIALVLCTAIVVAIVLCLWTLGWQYAFLRFFGVVMPFGLALLIFTVAILIAVTSVVLIIQSTNRR